LLLNLKTAKSLGLDVPNKLPALADEAIEQDSLLQRTSPLLADFVAEVGFAGRVQGRRYFWTQPRRWLCGSSMAERRR
jgi:hypothetical protein